MSAQSPSGRNRVVASLLAIFLGGLGLHKFYLGQATQGCVYLLLSWTMIPALIAFVEGIIYLTLTDEQFIQRYG